MHVTPNPMLITPNPIHRWKMHVGVSQELQVEPWREREHNHHSDDIPQRRRPTASARRQREAAVAEDAPHVDDAAEEVFQYAEEVVDDAEGFLGRSCDLSVLTAYIDHVAVIVWNGEVFIVFNKLYFNKYLLLLLKLF